jgi:predicted DNA-binding protein (MmcQ/YjbR family)
MAEENWNPVFRTLHEHCAAKPSAVEDQPWGEEDTVFKVRGKIFAFLGRSDHAGVTVKAAPDEVDRLLAFPYIKRSAYIGRYGWVNVSIENEDTLDLALRLVDQSYDLIAAKAGGGKRKPRPKSKGRRKDPS